MKTIRLLLGLMALIWAINVNGQTIYSTSTGGDWTSTSTWVGGLVPGSGNDVVINGIVEVHGTNYCNNLTVNTGAILQPYYYDNYTCVVYGNLINNGTIQNNSSYLYLNCFGDITNNGVWNNHQVAMYGTSAQTIISTAEFSTANFISSDTTGYLSAVGDLLFNNTSINLYSEQLYLNGFDLQVTGNRIYNSVIISDNGSLTGIGYSGLQDCHFYGNLNLFGQFEITGSGNHFYNNLTVNDTLQSYYYDHYTFYVHGTLTNNGVIRNNSSYLFANCKGDIVNNGIWNCQKIEMSGEQIQNITTNTPISTYSFISTDSLGYLSANSDLLFSGCSVNLNQEQLYLNGYDINLHSYSLSNALIYCDNGSITMSGDAKLYECSIFNNVELNGKIIIHGSGNHFYNNVTVNDTLENFYYDHYTCYVHGDLINNGIIRNFSAFLYINCKGSITNNGTWNCYRIDMSGDQVQTITTNTPITVNYLNSTDTAGSLSAIGDLYFTNCQVDLNDEELYLNGNTLFINGNNVRDGVIHSGNGSMSMVNNAYIYNCDVYGNIELNGISQVSDYNYFYNQVTITDTLRNYYSYYSSPTCYFYGDVVNNGLITHNNNYFTMNCYANITNNGNWSNNNIVMAGSAAQLINATEPFSPTSFYTSDTTGYLSAVSNLEFLNCNVDLNDEDFHLNGYDLHINGNVLQDGFVNAGGGSFSMTNNGYLYDCSIYGDVELKETSQVADYVSFYGDVEVTGTLRNYYSYYSYPTCYFYGDVINNGIINYNSNYFYMDCKANIVNNGVWDNYQISMSGDAEQTITCTDTITVDIFVSTDSAGFITAASNLLFYDVAIDFNGEELYLEGKDIYVAKDYLTECELVSGNGSITMASDAYMTSCNVYGDVELLGTVQINGNNNLFHNTMTIMGTLRNKYNYYSSYDCYTLGDVINNGAITNSNGQNFYLDIKGDFINNGTCNNYQVSLSGDGVQTITATQTLAPTYFYSTDTAGSVQLLSDLVFESTNIIFQDEDLYLNGFDLELTGDYISQTNIHGGYGSISMYGSAYLSDCNLFETISLDGTVEISGNDNYSYGSLIVTGTLRSKYNYYSNYTFNVVGDITNNGSIANNSNILYLNCKGNLFNSSNWSNSYTYLNGDVDQYIYVIDSSAIGGQLRMYAEVQGASTYEWYKNNLSLVGEPAGMFSNESSSYMYMNSPVGPDYFGEYYCATDSGNSRLISIMDLTPQVLADAGLDVDICEGESTTLTVLATDGTAPYAYLWSTGDTTENITEMPLATTAYYVTVTDAGGSIAIDTVQVTINANPIVDLGADQEICEGGSAMFEVWNGTSFLWSDGSMAPHLFTSIAGTYSLTVTDLNGCTGSDAAELIVNPLPLVDLGVDQEICEGSYTFLEVYGGDSYVWSTGSTNPFIEINTGGTYSLTMTDANGCSNSDELDIIENPLPVIDLGPDQNLSSGASAILDAGAGFMMYSWSDGTSSQTTTVSVSGTYSVTITDYYGCENTDEVIITIATPVGPSVYWVATTGSNTSGTGAETNPFLTIQHAINQCFENDTVMVMDGTYTGVGNTDLSCDTLNIVVQSENGAENCIIDGTGLSWGAGFNLSGGTDMTNVIRGFTIQNFNGYGVLINISSPTILNCIIQNNQTGIGSFGGWSGEIASPVLAYNLILNNTGDGIDLYDNGAPYAVNNTIVGNATGISCSMVIATLSNNIVVDNSIGFLKDQFSPTTIINSYNNVWNNTANFNNVSAGAGGVSVNPLFIGAGDYHLQSMSPCINTGNPAIYDLDGSISDMGAYPFEGTVTSPLVVDLGLDQSICIGASTSINAMVSGGTAPYTYLWSTGATVSTVNVTPTVTTTYSVTVSDANSATAVQSLLITVNSLPVVDLGADQEICEGDYTFLEVYGGDSYIWSTGSTFSFIEINTAGTYSLTMTDANGCSNSDAMNVIVNPLPTVDLGGNVFACEGDFVIFEPNLPGTYLWSTGSTMNHLVPMQSGYYSLTFTDANGCTATDGAEAIFSPTPTVDLGPDQTLPFGSTPVIDAGLGMSAYNWSTGASSQTITVAISGTYTVTVTDANGCTDSDDVIIDIQPQSNTLTVDVGADIAICEGYEAYITASAFDGTTPYSYSWSTGAASQSIFEFPTATTTYTVTVTDANAQTATDQITVTVNALPVVDLGFDIEICEGGTGFFGIYNTGTFLWSDGTAGSFIMPSNAGIYSVTVTDNNGCVNSDEAELIIHSNPVVDLGANFSSCEGSVEELHSNITGASYAWSNGSTNSYALVTTSDAYALTVTDTNGCSGSDEIEVLFNPQPIVDLGADQTILLGATYTFDAGVGFASYQWSTAASTQTIVANTAGSYAVTVTDANGCSNSDEVILHVNNPSSGPDWFTQITGVTHTILIPDTAIISIDGAPIALGDYIGVFYDSLGTPACGGYIVWTGQTTAISAWGDDTYTTNKDGFESGEVFSFAIWQASTGTEFYGQANYIPQPMMPDQGNYVVNGTSGILELNATSVDYQYIDLISGWSYFSTYINLFEANIDSLVSPFVQEVVLAKDGLGLTYWPIWNLNLIGDLQIGQAYQIKMSTPQLMVAEGIAVSPESTPLNIPLGWSMLGYLRQSPADVELLLSPIESDIFIMKDSYGNAYWPSYNLNLIGNMVPGAGYLIKLSSAVVYSYPANSMQLKVSDYESTPNRYFTNPASTGANMTLGIPLTAWKVLPDYGDEVGVFTENGKLVGSGTYTGENMAISVWGKDETSQMMDGLRSDEPFSLALWNTSENSVSNIRIHSFIEGDEYYENNKIAVIDELSTSAGLADEVQISVYPNPARTSTQLNLTLVEGSAVKIDLLNSNGDIVMQLTELYYDTGKHSVLINVDALPSGLYFARVYTTSKSYTRLFEVIK